MTSINLNNTILKPKPFSYFCPHQNKWIVLTDCSFSSRIYFRMYCQVWTRCP